MTPQTVMRLGFAAGLHVRGRAEPGREATCVVGRDTRISGEMLEAALAAGLTSAGVSVLRVGVVPTPAVSYLTRHLRAAAGAIISASHNPYRDNGVKFIGPAGQKLTETEEADIERLLEGLLDGELVRRQQQVAGDLIGGGRKLVGALDLYCDWAQAEFADARRSLAGLSIVADCANGAAFRSTPRVLEALGARVITLNAAPDGTNINAGCGSLHPDVLRRAVLDHRASLGLSHDGDADRVVMADEAGDVVDGDRILAITAAHLAARGELPHAAVVTTVMSNLGLDAALRPLGIRVHRTQVGDRHVKELMDREGIVLGGEPSGHVIFSRLSPTGDGLLTALQVLKVVVDERRPLSALHGAFVPFPQVLVNVRVRAKADLASIPGLSDAVADVERVLGDDGRVVLRYSGTEPVARVMVEGRSEVDVRRHAERVARVIREHIGAVE
jgi:phosphoglucosamine mutase